ncbi:MAG: AAA domain-containing protein [Chloroherpetonaceae bacterium]|nr:AAA domain-containing protein [Chloroherpetonaceae bacterium]
MADERPVVRVTDIGDYIRHGSCARRFKLDIESEHTRRLPFFHKLASAVDPVLQNAGKAREREWEISLRHAGLQDLCRYDLRPGEEEKTPWALFAQRAASLEVHQSGYGREVLLEGSLGAFRIAGRMDFVLVLWRDGRPYLRLVECKASRKDRTYHRIQLVLYRMLLRQALHATPLQIHGHCVEPEAIECVVARLDETTGTLNDILQLEPLDLDIEEADVTRLLAPDGPLLRILDTPLDALPYQLNEICDGCVYSTFCLPETARQRRVELLGIDATAARILRSVGAGTIDALAHLDLEGPQAQQVRTDPGFTESLDVLKVKAQARLSTLPGGSSTPEALQVKPLPHSGKGQLPEHVQRGRRLVRVFVTVGFDYAENRLGALAAHITRSDGILTTRFRIEDGKNVPDPDLIEEWKEPSTEGPAQERPVEGVDIAGVVTAPWTGDYEKDNRTEAHLIQKFFERIIQAIAQICPEESAPIHFYVWSRAEMARLVEACSRVHNDLLSSLRELLGCRESVEQLIYSCLQDEVTQRYALGWTGRGLTVVTSLRWFNRRFHWTRRVGDEIVALDQVFRNDLFDFRERLRLDRNGQWCPPEQPDALAHWFEVRACFQSSLTPPYWHAYWGSLIAPETAPDPRTRKALERYWRSHGYLKAYLKARTQALRWIEESVRFKNPDIVKPPLRIQDLQSFSLGVNDTARAALDFLYIEQHVRVSDWLARHLVPPVHRVAQGVTIPLRDVRLAGQYLTARIDLTGYPISIQDLALRCNLGKGAFVRLSPCSEDPQQSQTVQQLLRGGSTCTIEHIDWQTGSVQLAVVTLRHADRFRLASRAIDTYDRGFDFATLDESPSDYVSGHIEKRLQCPRGSYVYRWFDPKCPEIPPQTPLPEAQIQRYRALLQRVRYDGHPLQADQIDAVLDGLQTRVQLLQGPPGTGKTQTTAAALLTRVLARRHPGDVVLVSGNTHNAVDTLLERIARLFPHFYDAARALGMAMPRVRLAKAVSSATDAAGYALDGEIELFAPNEAGVHFLETRSRDVVLVIGGTPGSLMKIVERLNSRATYGQHPHGFQVPLLIVDEASMMVQPNFLALASLVTEDGELMLAGDHRQLPPIIQHDWANEDRPPTVMYQPYVSAYEAVQNLKIHAGVSDDRIRRSALTYSFRLPLAVREVIARLYQMDAIELQGREDVSPTPAPAPVLRWQSLWQAETGLFLVAHDEHESRSSNSTEAAIIEAILAAAPELPAGSVGLVMPHRAQRSLLVTRLQAYTTAVDVIDTVEKLQGGERDTIIVSATVSDPTAITARADFVLSPQRANVAFSRAKKRLIVVASEALLSSIPPEFDQYSAALLWKSLRALCVYPVGTTQVAGHTVRVLTLRPRSLSAGGIGC